MSLVFYVGEKPTNPLILDVDISNLLVDSIGEYTSVQIVSDGLPAGTSAVDIPKNAVTYTFTAPFSKPGRYSLHAELHKANGAVDFTKAVSFDVLTTSSAGLWVSPQEVYAITGKTVSGDDVLRAQGLIGSIVGTNLSSITERARYSSADEALLMQAISWQSAANARGSASGVGAVTSGLPGNVKAVSLDGISLSFDRATSGAGAGGDLDVFAKRFLLKLSTRRRAIHVLGYTEGLL